MIGLTRRTGEHCRLDPDHIQRVEAGCGTVVITTDGSHHSVRETVDQVIGRIVEDRAGDIAACYVLDRGEDAAPRGLRRPDPAPEAGTGVASLQGRSAPVSGRDGLRSGRSPRGGDTDPGRRRS